VTLSVASGRCLPCSPMIVVGLRLVVVVGGVLARARMLLLALSRRCWLVQETLARRHMSLRGGMAALHDNQYDDDDDDDGGSGETHSSDEWTDDD
jgi:hypothetical protein